ncbi:MAG: hypothetical protein AAGG02_01705 [Cyanobacteria bacterium P01_H01_bin.15]
MNRLKSSRCQLFLCGLVLSHWGFVACADAKTAQCLEFINVTQDVAQKTADLSQDRTTTEPEEVLLVADEFSAAAERLNKLELTDQGLVSYQQDFAQLYQDQATATRDFIKAYQAKELAGARTAKEEINRLGATEQTLVGQINTYCQNR